MRATLPAYLIHSILLISAQSTLAEETAETCGSPQQSLTSNKPYTLWDLGFSLQAKWSDLRELEQCPAPPDLICVAGGSECGDQAVMEQVAASIRPSETASGGHGPVETPVKEVEEDLVSFEDWKRRKLEEDEDGDIRDAVESISDPSQQAHSSDSVPTAGTQAVEQNKTNSNEGNKTQDGTGKNDTSKQHTKQSGEADAQIQQPKAQAHNKYNYASPDCSARIHSSSRLTQHASSILHKSRDRYMLTPCKADEHWVVVELCDEIRIEAVEIAVWEFFSGVVREVKVSVGGAEEDYGDGEDHTGDTSSGWEEVGTFIGKNVRGVQTFTLPKATSFQRFIRLDFPSYFGTEYYCPVSQVKVYGMNQMESFKAEQKRLAASANHRDKEKVTKEKESEERKQREKAELDDKARQQVKQEDEKREKELDELERLVLQQARRQGSAVPEISSFPNDMPTIEVVTVTASSPSAHSSPAAPMNSSADTHNATDQNKTTSNANTVSSSSSSSSRAPSPRSDSSESIYAHIIRRLNALEGNSSLVARYIEEQAKVMRHMLSRVEKGWDDWRVERELDEMSRWEQERMRQEDRLGQVISQMEQQRLAMDSERRAVLSELRVLSSELGYERRRGIAQLLITLVIIVLGVVSRSNTIDAVLKPLVAEARRRKSVYNSISGPLSGLQIDMGSNRPPAVIGFQPPRHLPPSQVSDGLPPAPLSTRHQRTNSMKRPLTPSRRRHYTGPGAIGNMRIFSDSTPHLAALHTPTNPTQNEMGSPFTLHSALKSPKPRVSLPPPRIVNSQRKLARSAHLHPMEADRVRRQMKSPTFGSGESTPRRNGNANGNGDGNGLGTSPLTTEDAVFSDGLEMEMEMMSDLETRSDWDTDAGGSVSEIEADLRADESSGQSPLGKPVEEVRPLEKPLG